MQKSDVFLKILKSVLSWLAWLLLSFCHGDFFELAMGAIFKIEPSQARISLFVGFSCWLEWDFPFLQESARQQSWWDCSNSNTFSRFLSLKFYYF